jgi:hypothetical protein
VSERRLGLIAFALCAVLAVAAGCSQEGRLIDVPLPVRAVAYDQNDSLDADTTTVMFRARFKVQVRTSNLCEAGHILLELSRIGPADSTVYVIRPVARYNLDDPCVSLGTGTKDTTLTLTINPLTIFNASKQRFEVKNVGGPSFFANLDSVIHAPVASTIRFEIRVQDENTAAAIPGANVALDSLTTAGAQPIASGVTDGAGLFVFDVPSTAAEGVDALRYRVTVTNGTDQAVVDVRDAPARGRTRERMTVRI